LNKAGGEVTTNLKNGQAVRKEGRKLGRKAVKRGWKAINLEEGEKNWPSSIGRRSNPPLWNSRRKF